MFTPRSCRLLITTNWPELVNKRIQAIEAQLREVSFANLSGELKVRGLIGRRITYLEYDGKCRRVEDRLQFETSAGPSFPETQKLSVELKSEYYLFQTRHISDSHAVLEQGLILKIDVATPELHPKSSAPLLAKVITDQGRSSELLRLPVRLPREGAEPKSFQGEVHLVEVPFEPGKADRVITDRLITGRLKGIVVYRTSRHLNAEFQYEREFQFLMKSKGCGAARSLRLDGQVADLAWRRIGPIEWLMELKLDYDWWLIDEKPLLCLIPEEQENSPGLQVKAPLFIDKLQFRLNHRFSLSQSEIPGHDLKMTVTDQRERLTQNALLISCDLVFEYYYINTSGDEAYRTLPLRFDHLVPLSKILWLGKDTTLKTMSKLSFEPLKISNSSPRSLDALVVIEINLYQEELLKIPESSSGTTAILARVFSEKQSFSITGSQVLLLRGQPMRIQKLNARLREAESFPRTGWLRLAGGVELTVTYLDQQGQMVEDTFILHFQESFIWELLRPTAEIDLKCRLEHDSYTVQGRRIRYEYLINCLAELFETRELKIIPVIGSAGTGDITNVKKPCHTWSRDGTAMGPNEYRLIFGGEVHLSATRTGTPLELAGSSFQLSGARCARLGEATLIEGNLTGIIEYWDINGYLRNEPVNLAFWSLRSRETGMPFGEIWRSPKLAQVSCTLIQTGFWGKAIVKINWELVFLPETSGSESAGEPEIFPKDDQTW